MGEAVRRKAVTETTVRLGHDDAKFIRHISIETGESAAVVVGRIISAALPNLPESERRIASAFRL